MARGAWLCHSSDFNASKTRRHDMFAFVSFAIVQISMRAKQGSQATDHPGGFAIVQISMRAKLRRGFKVARAALP